MEFERYEDIIDAFERDNMGYDTLTDYIKGQNIKLQGKSFTSDENLPIGPGSDASGIMRTDEAMMMAEGPQQAGEAKAQPEEVEEIKEKKVISLAGGGISELLEA